ncbi:MAG: thioredoxin family protein [Lentisphaeria bacterium]|nr:thioredoxin family protein [Lentisphaeria bacterium]
MQVLRLGLSLCFIFIIGCSEAPEQKVKHSQTTKEDSLVQTVSDDSFKDFVSAPGIVVINFGAPWCGVCVYMKPVVKQAAQELKPDVKFGYVDIDKYSKAADLFKVGPIPNFTVFRDGQPVGQFIGKADIEEFKELILQHEIKTKE